MTTTKPLYPDKKKGANPSSVKEAKKAYRENRRKYPRYEFLKQASLNHIKDHPCPVCGKHIHKRLPHNLVCPICLWEDDGMEKYPDEVSSANGKSFRQALSECKSD